MATKAADQPAPGPKVEDATKPQYSTEVLRYRAGDIPKDYQLKRYYTPADVAKHNSSHDCWVSYFGHVYDLTPLLTEYQASMVLLDPPESSRTYSSVWGEAYKISKLDSPGGSAWYPRSNVAGEWMQIDIGRLGVITGVELKQRARNSCVTEVLLEVSEDGDKWQDVPNGPFKVEYEGDDETTAAASIVFHRIQGRFVRFVIKSFNGWISMRAGVYVPEEAGAPLAQPIIDAAGGDISHWFEESTRQPKRHIDPRTGLDEIFCPWGRYIHVPPQGPEAMWATDYEIPWWEDKRYYIGSFTERTRKITIVNLLTKQKNTMEVPVEETIEEIRERYMIFNAHAKSYAWKRLGKPLDMKLTLQENGMLDETEKFLQLGIDPDEHIPVIHLYFLDDLTEA